MATKPLALRPKFERGSGGRLRHVDKVSYYVPSIKEMEVLDARDGDWTPDDEDCAEDDGGAAGNSLAHPHKAAGKDRFSDDAHDESRWSSPEDVEPVSRLRSPPLTPNRRKSGDRKLRLSQAKVYERSRRKEAEDRCDVAMKAASQSKPVVSRAKKRKKPAKGGMEPLAKRVRGDKASGFLEREDDVEEPPVIPEAETCAFKTWRSLRPNDDLPDMTGTLDVDSEDDGFHTARDPDDCQVVDSPARRAAVVSTTVNAEMTRSEDTVRPPAEKQNPLVHTASEVNSPDCRAANPMAAAATPIKAAIPTPTATATGIPTPTATATGTPPTPPATATSVQTQSCSDSKDQKPANGLFGTSGGAAQASQLPLSSEYDGMDLEALELRNRFERQMNTLRNDYEREVILLMKKKRKRRE